MKLPLPDELKELIGQGVKNNSSGEHEYIIEKYCDSGKRGHVFCAHRIFGGQYALKFLSFVPASTTLFEFQRRFIRVRPSK